MRDVLRTIREVQTATYLSQVINEVVPLENDVINAEPDTELVHHSCVYPSGAEYEGSFRVDKFGAAAPANYGLERREGHGKYTEACGSRYEGEWKAGQRHGRGVQWWAATGDEYQGEWKANRRHGQGRLCCTDGRVYSGGWAADREEGRGKLVNADNSAYDGNFAAGQYHGSGVKVWPNAQRYKGEWRCGQEHGRGLLSYPDGSFYLGEFVDGKMHGKGLLQVDGVNYEGEFENNLAHGKGRQWQDEPGAVAQSFLAPERERGAGGARGGARGSKLLRQEALAHHEVHALAGGGVYDGEWKRGLKDGFGCYKGADGTVYEGEYRHDVKSGAGTLRWPDGQVQRGRAKDSGWERFEQDGWAGGNEWGTECLHSVRAHTHKHASLLLSLSLSLPPSLPPSPSLSLCRREPNPRPYQAC